MKTQYYVTNGVSLGQTKEGVSKLLISCSLGMPSVYRILMAEEANRIALP